MAPISSFDKLSYCSSVITKGCSCENTPAAHRSNALLLKQMLKKQTVFVLLLKQNKSDSEFHPQN